MACGSSACGTSILRFSPVGDPGNRGSFVAIRELRFGRRPDLGSWKPGPAEFLVREDDHIVRHGASDRLLYFSARVESALYGGGRRMWLEDARLADNPSETCVMEMVLFRVRAEGDWRGLVVAHLPLPADIDRAVAAIDVAPSQIGVWAEQRPELRVAGLRTSRRDRSYVFSFERVAARDQGVATAERVGWSLAARRSFERAPDWAEAIDRLREQGGVHTLVRRASLVVHRAGAAVVVNDTGPFRSLLDANPSDEPTGLAERAQASCHTVFTDACLLGMMQRVGLHSIADESVRLSSARPSVRGLINLEADFARFKSTYWWHQITEEEEANIILRGFQTHHGLDDLLAEVGRDLGHFAAQVQTLSAARSGAALGLLTLVLFPLTVLVAFAQAVLPQGTGLLLTTLVFVATVPLSLLLGLGIAAAIPGQLSFLRDVFAAGREDTEA